MLSKQDKFMVAKRRNSSSTWTRRIEGVVNGEKIAKINKEIQNGDAAQLKQGSKEGYLDVPWHKSTFMDVNIWFSSGCVCRRRIR